MDSESKKSLDITALGIFFRVSESYGLSWGYRGCCGGKWGQSWLYAIWTTRGPC